MSKEMEFAIMDIRSFRNTLINIDTDFEKLKKKKAIEGDTDDDLRMILDCQHAIKRIEAVFQVFARGGHIYPNYAKEKMENAKLILENIERHFTNKI